MDGVKVHQFRDSPNRSRSTLLLKVTPEFHSLSMRVAICPETSYSLIQGNVISLSKLLEQRKSQFRGRAKAIFEGERVPSRLLLLFSSTLWYPE